MIWTIGTLIWGIIKINMEIIMTGIIKSNTGDSMLEEGETNFLDVPMSFSTF